MKSSQRSLKPRNKTLGEVRYWTYYLEFQDGDQWWQQIPFVHELSYELPRTSFGKVPELAQALLKKGECHWKDNNGVIHRVRIENEWKAKKWGKPKRPVLISSR